MLEKPRIRYVGIEVQGDRGFLIDKIPGTSGWGIKDKTSVHPGGHPTLVELRDQARMLARPNNEGQADSSTTDEVVVLGFVNCDLRDEAKKASATRRREQKLTSPNDTFRQ